MAEPLYDMARDGAFVMRGAWIECCRYIHCVHSFSFDWAVKYEGYSLQVVG